MFPGETQPIIIYVITFPTADTPWSGGCRNLRIPEYTRLDGFEGALPRESAIFRFPTSSSTRFHTLLRVDQAQFMAERGVHDATAEGASFEGEDDLPHDDLGADSIPIWNSFAPERLRPVSTVGLLPFMTKMNCAGRPAR